MNATAYLDPATLSSETVTNDEREDMVFEYTVTYEDEDTGEIKTDTLDGVSDAHACEEAWYEFSTKIIGVKRGDPCGYTA